MNAPIQFRDDPSALLQARLEEIPSVFARLVLLASKARPRLWRSIDPVARSAAPDPKILQRLQIRALRQWLAMPTQHKVKDIRIYLDSLCRGDIPETADSMSFCPTLVPRAASTAEAHLFVGTVRFVLEILFGSEDIQ